MLEPAEIPRGGGGRHEEVFLARYAKLRAWALGLTGGDAARAEDLVHDAFVQFTFARPDLGGVQNLDGYLYRMLRNLNISQMRRTRGRREGPLAVFEYDSAEFVLRATDPRDSIRVQDDLRQVCRYACLRKETSKAGSVLILRFMHGYYPAEIARVCASTREAVEERLRVARSEAAQFLKDPTSLRFLAREGARAQAATPGGFAQTAEELLDDLRRRVFDSRRGACLTEGELTKLYEDDARGGPGCAALAHVVSCPVCIEGVNRIHGLPPLAERYPVDALGVDVSRKGGGGKDGGGDGNGGRGGGGVGGGGGDDDGGGATGGASGDEARRCRRRARDVFEHRPRELRVSVNGRLLAAQKVSAILNEQKLNVLEGEEVSFVEVFSEQDVRLLYLDPSAWADEGGGCSLSVGLSEGRTLEARLSYVDSAPTVKVAYRDPLMAAEASRLSERAGEEAGREAAGVGGEARAGRGRAGVVAAAWGWLRELVARLLSPLAAVRPAAWAASVAVLVVAALLLTKFDVARVSAAELLRRAALAEESFGKEGAGLVVHRTVFVEELKADGRSVASRRRVETWQGGASGIRLRRLYDEQNRLIAGEWTKSDGTSAVYRRGSPPFEAGAATARELLDAGEVWRIEPSAKIFAALGAGGDALKVDERLAAYVLSYEAAAGAEGGLLGGSLWLNKSDLHAFRMTLVARRGGASVEYRFIEGGLEKKRAEEVPPGVYQLEPELLEAAKVTDDEGRGTNQKRVEDAPSHPSSLIPHPSAVASAELEVEVAYLLNQIKANLGEQVSMGRTTGGALRVDALVESEGRKEAILRALGPVIGNPAVVVEVNTVAEALAKREKAAQSKFTEREVSVGAGRVPADAELRAHFGSRIAGDARVDAEIKQFAARAMSRSRQALLHASALKRLVGRFKPSEARALESGAREKWLSMVREHAGAYRREVSALRSQLGAVFGAGGVGAADETVNEANVAAAAERLLQLSYAQDGAVRSAFTISEEGGAASSIKSAQFWRTLAASERLAAAIEDAYER